MKKTGLILLAASMTLTFTACNNATDSVDQAENINEQKEEQNVNMVDTKAADFAVKATAGGLAEVAFSQLAKEKSSRSEVQEFADMMINDHTTANERLRQIALAKNITLPDSMSVEHRKDKNQLAEKTGSDFDRAYLEQMEKDHEATIDLFEDAANNLADPELKAFAAETLPTLKGHLADCRKILETLK